MAIGCAMLGVLCGPALAAGVPTVATGGAKSVTATSATLTGTVNPNGESTSYHFEHGTTTAYGSTSPTGDAGSGTKNVNASEAISGLAPNTKYHYRLVASNSSGT